MPRGRKKKEDITLEQQLENIATEIANKEAELKELKKQVEAQKVNALLAIVKEKGMSIQEAIDLFSDKKEENNEQ